MKRPACISALLLPLVLVLTSCAGGSGGVSNKQTANVNVLSSYSSITQGQPVTLEAYVNPVLATGTVTFYNGSTQLGTASLTSFLTTSVALITTTFNSIGPQNITVHYNGNDFYAAGTSSPITIGVYSSQLAVSSVTLAASTTTPQYQTPVTVTASVAPSSATGIVTFYNGATNIGSSAVTNGSATLTTSFSAGGTALLHAVYSGDYTYLSSTSAPITLNISGPLVTSTTLAASTTSTAIGNSVALTATLTPAAATGSVTFYNGTTSLGTASVASGVATLNTTFSTAGIATLKAVFAANASYETSTSAPVSIFVTGTSPTSITLQASPTSLIIGYSSTLTVALSPATATGTVNLYDGTRFIDSLTIGGGTAQFTDTFSIAGSQSVTAVYSGNTTYLAAISAPVILTVSNPGTKPTTTLLTLSENSGTTGDTVTLSIGVSPASATGQVTILDNGNTLATVPLIAGQAVWSQTFTQYSNALVANYNGDVTYSPSSSNVQDLNLSDPYSPSPPTDPSCPTDPTLCPIFCPGDITCPMLHAAPISSNLHDAPPPAAQIENRTTRLPTDPSPDQ